jgi:hypothetical protein
MIAIKEYPAVYFEFRLGIAGSESVALIGTPAVTIKPRLFMITLRLLY